MSSNSATVTESDAAMQAGARADKARVPASQNPPAAGLSLQDYLGIYDAFRKYLTHEDDLVHQRTTWSITIQSFSIAAVGWVFTAMMSEINGNNSYRAYECNRLIQFFCVLGVGVSLISAGGIFAAQRAIHRLETDWNKQSANSPYQGYLPKLSGGGSRLALWMGHALPLFLPIFLMCLWIILWVYMYNIQLYPGFPE